MPGSPLSCVASEKGTGCSTNAAIPAASKAGICICWTLAVPRSSSKCSPLMLAAAANESGSSATAEMESRLPISDQDRRAGGQWRTMNDVANRRSSKLANESMNRANEENEQAHGYELAERPSPHNLPLYLFIQTHFVGSGYRKALHTVTSLLPLHDLALLSYISLFRILRPRIVASVLGYHRSNPHGMVLSSGDVGEK
jgi:hypothetical protein